MMQRWHGWEGAGDINEEEHKQDAVKDKGRMEGVVSQKSSGGVGADVRERVDISDSKRRRPSGPNLCASTIPLSLRPFPVFRNLASFPILARFGHRFH